MSDTPLAAEILRSLQQVEAQRRLRDATPALHVRTHEVKRFQQFRFEATYPEFLSDSRYAPAARFFLDELYGPADFAARDAQFARIVPALVRLFPHDIVETVRALAELHALSEQLDTAMAQHAGSAGLDRSSYAEAWRAVGQPEARQRQIELVMEVGQALDRYTRKPLLRQTLRLMRGPAHAAGLEALQRFLERGFDSFRAMSGAEAFLRTVQQRESELARRLFDGDATALPGTPATPA